MAVSLRVSELKDPKMGIPTVLSCAAAQPDKDTQFTTHEVQKAESTVYYSRGMPSTLKAV